MFHAAGTLVIGLMALTGYGGSAMGAAERPHVVPFSALPGWAQADHRAALQAFRRSCKVMMREPFRKKARFGGRREDWRAACRAAVRVPDARRAARAFFERHFLPVTVQRGGRPSGLFTGYYEPEAEGALKPDATYRFPLLARPGDLVAFTPAEARIAGTRYGRRVNGRPVPYFTRREIESGALKGRGLEIVWLKSLADAFFIQVQGSGRIRLKEGGVLRLSYAAKSGRPYTPVGRILVERGEIPKERMSMQAIRAWIARNPGRARELLWRNESYVFFREVKLPDPRLGAFGAQGVQLAPMVSLAVDWRHWAYGSPVWLETSVPDTDGAGERPFRRLMVAQDTGSAIRGAVRGDIYFGFGKAAAARAGRMKAPGFMAVLLPVRLARRLTGGNPRLR